MNETAIAEWRRRIRGQLDAAGIEVTATVQRRLDAYEDAVRVVEQERATGERAVGEGGMTKAEQAHQRAVDGLVKLLWRQDEPEEGGRNSQRRDGPITE